MEVFTKNETILYNLRTLYEQYGYKRFKMNKFEEYDLYLEYKKFLSTQNIITFTDLSGKLYALKPDITLSIAKNAKEGETQKLYYNENVYRASRSTKEYKEITQLGLEYIGEIDAYTLGEVVLLAAQSLCSISRGYVLDISHMGFILGAFEQAGLSDAQQEKMLGFLGKKETHEILAYCSALGLEAETSKMLASLSEIYGSFETTFAKIKPLIKNEKMRAAADELEQLHSFISAGGEGGHLNLDFSIVNDMSYYNGVIFRGYVQGVPASVLSGGRYDNLLQRLGKGTQAIGFAVYVDLLELYDKYDKAYDVDVMVVYDSSVSPLEVSKLAAEYTRAGACVKVMREIPEGIKYKKLVRITEKGAETTGGNA